MSGQQAEQFSVHPDRRRADAARDLQTPGHPRQQEGAELQCLSRHDHPAATRHDGTTAVATADYDRRVLRGSRSAEDPGVSEARPDPHRRQRRRVASAA